MSEALQRRVCGRSAGPGEGNSGLGAVRGIHARRAPKHLQVGVDSRQCGDVGDVRLEGRKWGRGTTASAMNVEFTPLNCRCDMFIRITSLRFTPCRRKKEMLK